MIRTTTIVLTCCCQLAAAGQSIMRRYDALGQLRAETGFGVELTTDGGAVVFLGSQYADDSLLYTSNVVTLRLDPLGVPLDTNLIFFPLLSTYPGHANVAFSRTGGGFGVGGSSWDGTTGRPVLYLFDSLGVVEGIYQYGDSGQTWTGRQGKAALDGGYVICGETSSSGTSLDAFLLKIDSAGNQEWVITYGLPNQQEYASSIDLSMDGGYYIGGQRSVSPGVYDQWVLATDSAGALIWSESFGSPFDDGPSAHVLTVADSSIVFASAWAVDNGLQHLLGLAKIDPQGALIWSKRYDGLAGPSALFVVKEIVWNGDLVAAGYSYRPGYLQGTLLRTNAQGDSLWMRYYHYEDSLITEGTGLFRDVLPTPDGGFIAVGAAYNSNNPNDPLVYSQDTWVVKVDSLGCLVPGCDGIGMISAQVTNLRDALQVAPNPASTTAQLTWHLPAHLSKGKAQLSVVSSSGAVQRSEELDLSRGTHALDVQALASGVYYLHVVQEGTWVTGTKLLVE